jgi:hypothetical protein
VSGGGLSSLRRAEQEATVAKLGLNEKLDFEMVGKTVFQLKEDIASLKARNALRRAQRDRMVRARVCLNAFAWCPRCAPDDSTYDGTDALRAAMRSTQRAAAKITEAKLAQETGIVRMPWRVESTAVVVSALSSKGVLAQRGRTAQGVATGNPRRAQLSMPTNAPFLGRWATTEVCIMGGAQDNMTLDNAMAAAMNDVNGNASALMSEQQMEGELMKAARMELNQMSGQTGGTVHYMLIILVLMVVAGLVYVLYAKPTYGV